MSRAVALYRARPWRVVERNTIVARRRWYVYVVGGAEPFLFLFSVGVGVGALIDSVAGPTGEPIAYREFVAPAMLAGAAMNTAVFTSTIDFFVRFRYLQTYDAMLATPLTPRDVVRGELTWTLLRIAFYGTAFVVTMLAMGLVSSPGVVLAVPATVLVGLAFACIGMAASTWLRSWLDFDLVMVATVPLFLFSATFFPLDRYPDWLQAVARVSPLYHGTDLLRRLVLGGLGWGQVVSVVYLAVLAAGGLAVAERRVARQLQP